MARRKKKHSAILMASVVAHVLAFVGLALIPQKKLREVVAIALREAPPKEEKKVEPPKPPEHPPARPAHAAAHVAHPTTVPQPSAAAAAATDTSAFTNLGLTLDSSSSDGLAVPVAPRPAAIAPPPAPPKPKLLVPRHAESECSEELVKARPLELVRPSYTDEARRARVQGRIRIELAIDEHGDVTHARLLGGLGYGLDEIALEAARKLRFSPAQRCNRPVAAPFVLAMRFVLNT